jgi:hypothetical protein
MAFRHMSNNYIICYMYESQNSNRTNTLR